MSAISLALLKFAAPTLARSVLTLLLRDQISGGDLAEQLVDSADLASLIGRVTDDYKQQQNGRRLVENIGEQAAESLAKVFAIEGDEFSEAEQEVIAKAVAESLGEHGLKLLLASDLDQTRFRQALLRVDPPASLHSMDHVLFYRVLEEASQRIFAFAEQLPKFERDTAAQLLQRSSTLNDKVEEIGQKVNAIYASSKRHNPEKADAAFERDYRLLIGRSFDKMHLFGVRQIENYEHPLTVAYTTLNAITLLEAKDEIEAHTFFAKQQRTEKVLPAPEALAQGERLLVVGLAGSGKTTLLKWLAVHAANEDLPTPLAAWNDKLPFFVRLRDFARRPLPDIDQLPLAVPGFDAQLRGRLRDGWTTEQLQQNRALLLIDGLDEISNKQRDELFVWLDNLLTIYPNLVCVVSTRNATAQQPQVATRLRRLALKPLELQSLSPEQIKHLIHNWHRAMADERSDLMSTQKRMLPTFEKRLQKSWNEPHNQLQELMTNPLLCAMVCALHQRRKGQLPRDRVELYDNCIEMLLEARDREREVDTQNYVDATLRELRELLGGLAYWMLSNGEATIDRNMAIEKLGRGRRNGEAILCRLHERSNLLQAYSPDEFDFVHRTLLEYLAARAILRENNLGLLVSQAHQPSWRNTVHLVACAAETPLARQQLIEKLCARAETEEGKQQTLLLHLALECHSLMVIPPSTQKLKDALATQIKKRNVQIKFQTVEVVSQHLTEVALGRIDNHVLWVYEHLQVLYLSNTQVSDLLPLATLPHLQFLDLRNTQVNDLLPLANSPHLQLLDLRNLSTEGLFDQGDWATLRAVWLDNPNTLPAPLRERLDINPSGGPYEYWQKLNREKSNEEKK
ncbi:MAG: NACHT domain-containing protein [Candidatus Promineifilaceae bacterium]